jgi:hypothetical protein
MQWLGNSLAWLGPRGPFIFGLFGRRAGVKRIPDMLRWWMKFKDLKVRRLLEFGIKSYKSYYF